MLSTTARGHTIAPFPDAILQRRWCTEAAFAGLLASEHSVESAAASFSIAVHTACAQATMQRCDGFENPNNPAGTSRRVLVASFPPVAHDSFVVSGCRMMADCYRL
jgi:hypothetical protein